MRFLLRLCPDLLHRIEAKGILIILVALDWFCPPWYTSDVWLVTDIPWQLPLPEDLLS